MAGQVDYAKGNRFAWPGGVADDAAGAPGSAASCCRWLTRLASGYWHVGDSQCGYTVASRQALRAIGPDLFARYGYPNDLLTRLAAARVRVVDVPVRPVYGPQLAIGAAPDAGGAADRAAAAAGARAAHARPVGGGAPRGPWTGGAPP